jgi:hypothetical protein
VAGGPESDGCCGGAIGIVGTASYGTKGWVEFGLGAEGFVNRLSLCWREDSLAAV